MEQRMVTVEARAYEELVTRSERLACVERLLETSDYISTDTVMALLCVKKGRGENAAV